jgi:hypothetical protein
MWPPLRLRPRWKVRAWRDRRPGVRAACVCASCSRGGCSAGHRGHGQHVHHVSWPIPDGCAPATDPHDQDLHPFLRRSRGPRRLG